jgi:hypothetical protein
MYRTPVRTVPQSVSRWTGGLWWLRAADALAAWLAAWVLLLVWLEKGSPDAIGVLAALVVAGLAFVQPIRIRWRPVTGLVFLRASRALRPGDRAWYVRPGAVEPVLVTGRRGVRLVIARPGEGAEGLAVRRTRVLVLPSELRAVRAR